MLLCSITPSGFVRYFISIFKVPIPLLNCHFVKNPDAQNVVNKLCLQDMSLTVEDCFGMDDDAKDQVTDLSQDRRLWVFQYCTQWGYLTVRISHSSAPFPMSMWSIQRSRLRMAFPRSSHAFWVLTMNARSAPRPFHQESTTEYHYCRTSPL